MSEIQFGKRYRCKYEYGGRLDEFLTPVCYCNHAYSGAIEVAYGEDGRDDGGRRAVVINWFTDHYELYESQDDQPAPDPVNHPAHYNQDANIECIDAIRAALGMDRFLDYCVGNNLKYSWRWRGKNGIEDLKKARWYLTKAIDAAEETQSQTE
jgi:hypothetical protein